MKRLVLALFFMYWPLAPLMATAAAPMTATCHAEYGLSTETLHLPASADVFAFQSVSLGDRFLFKAQLLPLLVLELCHWLPLCCHSAAPPPAALGLLALLPCWGWWGGRGCSFAGLGQP